MDTPSLNLDAGSMNDQYSGLAQLLMQLANSGQIPGAFRPAYGSQNYQPMGRSINQPQAPGPDLTARMEGPMSVGLASQPGYAGQYYSPAEVRRDQNDALRGGQHPGR